MALFLRRSKTACLVVLAAVLVLSGCSGAVSSAPQAFLAAAALPAANSDDAGAMASYLGSTLDDFKVIDELINDDAFNDEITADSLENYLGILEDYDTKIRNRLAVIEKRDAPNHADVASFRAAELSEFQLASDIIEEYIQVVKYVISMTATTDEMAKLEQLDNVDDSDLQGIYDAVSKSLTKAIEELKNDDVPTFWKSMNDSFIDALSQMNDAVYYYLSAIAMNDPVRMSAADYRMGILTRKFDAISKESEQDYADREKKLNGDIDSIQHTNDALRDWVQGNIEKLGEQ